MTLLALAAFVCLAVYNTRLANSPFYPPAVFAAIWAGLLLLLLLSGDRLYPLLEGSLAIFVVGAASYSFGGHYGFMLPQRTGPPLSRSHRAFLSGVFNVTLIAMIVVAIFYFDRLSQIINNSQVTQDSLLALRSELSNTDSGVLDIGLYKYAIALFDFLALVAWCECDGSSWQRIRCWIMAAFALAYQLSTTARIGALLFVFALLWIVLFRKKRVTIGPLLVGAVVIVTIFASAAILLNKGGNREADLLENASGVFDSFVVYLLGGSVAFNEVVANPALVRQDLFAFFYHVANAFGANYEVWRIEPVFVSVPDWTNVYTLYMSVYAQFSFLGVVLYMLLLGGISAWIYKGAVRGSPWATVFSARIAGSLLLTGAADPYLPALSTWIQLSVFCWLVYELPRLFLHRSSVTEAMRFQIA